MTARNVAPCGRERLYYSIFGIWIMPHIPPRRRPLPMQFAALKGFCATSASALPVCQSRITESRPALKEFRPGPARLTAGSPLIYVHWRQMEISTSALDLKFAHTEHSSACLQCSNLQQYTSYCECRVKSLSGLYGFEAAASVRFWRPVTDCVFMETRQGFSHQTRSRSLPHMTFMHRHSRPYLYLNTVSSVCRKVRPQTVGFTCFKRIRLHNRHDI